MGDLTELIRAEIEAKRKEVQKRHEENCRELNVKSRQEYKSLKKIEKELMRIKKLITLLEEEEEEEKVEAEVVEEIDDDNEFLNSFSVMTDATIVATTDSVNNNDNNNNNSNYINKNNNNVDYTIDTIEKLDRPIDHDNNNSNNNIDNDGRDVNDFCSRITINDVIHNNDDNNNDNDNKDDENNENNENNMVMNSNSIENILNKESRSREGNNHSPSFPSSLSPSSLSTTFRLNDSKSFPNHLTNKKIEINKAYDKRKELLSIRKKITENKQKITEKLKREREAYQKTLQEHDDFELRLTTISEGFETDQNRALLDLVKELKENGMDHNNEDDKSPDETTNNDVVERNNKRKNEEVSNNGEVHTSKKVKYVATGFIIGLAPWVINNLPLLQQHLQNLPFI